MEKKLNKEERIKDKERMSNVVTGKMAAVFGFLVVALMILIYYGTRVPGLSLLVVAQVVTALACAAALVRFGFALSKGADTRYQIFSPLLTLGLAASALFMTLMYPSIGSTYTILALIAFAVLFFVYEIYPVDFFICTAAVFSGCITAAVVNSPSFTLIKDIAALLVYAAIMALCIAATYSLTKNGKIKLGKKKIKKPQGMLPLAVYACAAVSLLAALGVLFFGYLLYFVAAACVVYFIVAIIYTVKLM